jgi:flagellar hook-basal body complex protein FliE
MRESGVAFNLMLEIRNKMQESYQTLMRMSV